jgi:hypothetical protein
MNMEPLAKDEKGEMNLVAHPPHRGDHGQTFASNGCPEAASHKTSEPVRSKKKKVERREMR